MRELTSATSGSPRDWKESWELQSKRLGPSKAVPLEGPEGVRVVLLPLSGETILAGNVKEIKINRKMVNSWTEQKNKENTVGTLIENWLNEVSSFKYS